ncbi:MAG: PepSY-like domain-containing protein [Chitinophagaceae bacterium]
MKKIFLLMTLSVLLLVACDKEKVVQSDDLPANASGFVTTHYASKQILQVVKELDNLKTYFHVYLNNGSKLDFSRKGDIKKIEGVEAIPDTVIPSLILNYVDTHYPNDFIRGWEIEDATQNVKLSTSIQLEFDKNGNFLRVDG